MSVELESAKRLNALKSKADAKTGETSDTLSDAVDTLIAGYGQGGGGDDLLGIRLDDNSEELYEYQNDQITRLAGYAFYYDVRIKKVSLPNCTFIGTNAFQEAKNLQEVELPKLSGCSGQYQFRNIGVTKLVFPNYKEKGFPQIWDNRYLKIIDTFAPPKFNNNGIRSNYSLVALIIRKSDGISTLEGATFFQLCYHFLGTVDATYNPDGLKDGYIYVPRALVETYQNATNWSQFADRFRALEDYTVDGTITGELDESKI